MATNLNWDRDIIPRAIEIVEDYDTDVTLRQLFYRLVSEELIPNEQTKYGYLSTKTADLRRHGQFPDLVDTTRTISRDMTFRDVEHAKDWLGEVYQRDHTEGQVLSLYIAVEKKGLVAQLRSWFGDYGIPILALGGYASQTSIDIIAADIERQGRPAAIMYAGDHDPSGEDIENDLRKRLSYKVTRTFYAKRLALTWDQVVAYDLPPQLGKAKDARAKDFRAKYGRLVQVELDALPPDVLRSLYQDVIDQVWDDDAYQASLQQEREDLTQL